MERGKGKDTERKLNDCGNEELERQHMDIRERQGSRGSVYDTRSSRRGENEMWDNGRVKMIVL
eukprot:500992-Pyramimonas_sp.AAC.1